MAAQSRSSQPTIRERLGALPGLSPSIRASSLSSYDEARPGYVERDYLAGNSMARLARSLAGFDQTLIPVMEKYYDRKIERDIARGAELYAQNEALDKNRTNWKDYVEAHPEFRGLNPHLQKGYEQARLKALGMDQKKALEDAFVQSGMINERDQEKVNQWVQEFAGNFRREHHLDTYEDKLALAESFSPEEFKNRAALLNKHSLYLQKQNEARAIQQFSDLAVKELEAFFDPAHGGRLLGDPATAHQDAQDISEVIGKHTQEALKNGVLNANAGEMMTNIALTLYEKSGRNPAALKVLDRLQTPDGVTVSSLPGVATKIHTLKQARIEEARAAERHWWAQQEQARKREKEYFEGEGVVQWSQKGLPPTTENMDAAGVPKRMQPTFAAAVNKWNQAQYTGQKEAPFNQRMLLGFQMLAAIGGMDHDTLTEWAPLIGYDPAKDLYDRNKKAQEEEEKTYTTELKSGMSKVYAMFARDKKDLTDVLKSVSFGFSSALTQEQLQGLEAAQLFEAKFKLAKNEYKTKNKEAPSREYLVAIEPKLISEVHTEMRSKYGNAGTGLSIPGQSASTAQNQPNPPSAQSAPNTAAPRTADPLNTVISEWINASGLQVPADVNARPSSEKLLWLQSNHPDKTPELHELIRAHTNKARR